MIIDKQFIDGNAITTIKADDGKNIIRVNGGVLLCKYYTLNVNDKLSDFIEVDDGNDYKVIRQNAYPTIAEQLDMIYHDKENGTNNWFETIKAVKEKYPKEG